MTGFGSIAIWLQDGSQLFSEGSVLDHNHLTRYYNVQEQSLIWGTATIGNATTVNPYNYGVAPAKAEYRFTDFDGLSNLGYHTYMSSTNWVYASLLMRDCTLNSGLLNLGGYNTSALALNNNLFESVGAWFGDAPQITFYNNLYRYGSISSLNAGTNNWLFYDNAFDSISLTALGNPVTAGYNAYINMGSNRFYPTNANDKVLSSFTYATGTLGNYYQSSTNLYDMGSRTSDLAGLYHYTVKTSQAKETNSLVDIGYHYVSLNGSNQPNDYDGDGIPDYVEDRNGNGTVNSGETHWQSATDFGLKVWITEPKNNSNLP